MTDLNVKNQLQSNTTLGFFKMILTELINPSADNSHSTEGRQFSCYHNRISSDFAVLQIQIPPENFFNNKYSTYNSKKIQSNFDRLFSCFIILIKVIFVQLLT